ncbi:MAG: hypothetical protein ACRC8M_03860 [Cetobacterium sp.]|uniref:hypothetical protein n=1 Tax=Cetobacterium sp. TaxID=2071632 RepID=UPI003F3DFA70
MKVYRHIRDLENFLNETDISKIQTKLSQDTNLEISLKNRQEFMADERKMFIILKFVEMDIINISNLNKELSVTRRTLSNDLYSLGILLEKYNLKLISLNGHGVSLEGEEVDKRKIFHKYSLKLIIEWKYLPSKFLDFFIKPQQIIKSKNIDFTIYQLLKSANLLEISSVLKFWISSLVFISIVRENYKDNSLQSNIKTTFNEIDSIFNESYSLTNYEKEKIDSIFLKKIWLKEKQDLNVLIQNFEKKLGLELLLTENESYNFNSILITIAIKNHLKIKELNFFNINSIIEKSIEFKKLEKLIEKNLINSDNSENLNFLYLLIDLLNKRLKSLLENKEKIVFLYHSLSKNLIKNACEILELKNCCEIVSAFEFDRYVDNHIVTAIILLEDIYLDKKYKKIKKIRFDCPIYKLERLLLYKFIDKK